MLKGFIQFLEEVWREVRPDKGRVSWPTMKAIRVSTVLVMVCSLLLAGYIFACDTLLSRTLGAFLQVK